MRQNGAVVLLIWAGKQEVCAYSMGVRRGAEAIDWNWRFEFGNRRDQSVVCHRCSRSLSSFFEGEYTSVRLMSDS